MSPKHWLAESSSFYSPVNGFKRKKHDDFINYNFRGLRNVYLRNGYTLHNDGVALLARVAKPLELERVVVVALAESVCPLSAEAFRFLRRVISMTRPELALLLGVTARDVLMWEYRGKEAPAVAELVIRTLAKEHCTGFAELALIAVVVGRLEKRAEIDIHLEYVNSRWSSVED